MKACARVETTFLKACARVEATFMKACARVETTFMKACARASREQSDVSRFPTHAPHPPLLENPLELRRRIIIMIIIMWRRGMSLKIR